jgi:hypothetical protein
VVGAIVAINSMHQTCRVDTGQRQINCWYDMSVARMIRHSLADEETLLPKVALSGTATLRRGGGIAAFQRVTQIAKAGNEAQEVIVGKLQLLRDLTDGWAGPGSVRVDEGSIERFEEFLRVLGGRATDELEPLGLADGGIRLEWQRFGVEYVAEVEPHGNMYLCRLPPDPRGDLDESREGPFDPLASPSSSETASSAMPDDRCDLIESPDLALWRQAPAGLMKAGEL